MEWFRPVRRGMIFVTVMDAKPKFHFPLLEGLGDGLYAVDADWRVTVFNSVAAEWFGVSERQALGRTLWDLLPRVLGSDYEISYRRVMESREPEEFITRSLSRPGRFIEVRAFPLGDGLGAGFRDATERMQCRSASCARGLRAKPSA